MQARIDALTALNPGTKELQTYKDFNEEQKQAKIERIAKYQQDVEKGVIINGEYRANLARIGIDENGAAIPSPPDYCEGDDICGIFEIKGKRPTQEDRVYAERDFSELEEVSTSEIKFLLRKYFKSLQEHCGKYKNEGATVICTASRTYLEKNKIILEIQTAHVGDSEAYLFTINEATGECVHSEKLNGTHHLKHNDNLNTKDYRLSMYRSIGDCIFEGTESPRTKKPYSHEPDLTLVKHELKPGEVTFSLVNCDGLTESKLTLKDISDIIAKNHKKPPAEIAFQLGKAAYSRGTGDNTSLMLTRIHEPEIKDFESFTEFKLLADGHGGIAAAQTIQDYAPKFEKMVSHYIQNREKISAEIQELKKLFDNFQEQILCVICPEKSDYVRSIREKGDYEQCEKLNKELRRYLAKRPSLAEKTEIYFKIEDSLLQPLRAKKLEPHHQLQFFTAFLDSFSKKNAPQRGWFDFGFWENDSSDFLIQDLARQAKAQIQTIEAYINLPASEEELKASGGRRL